MDDAERLRATIISTFVRDTPKQFWVDLRGAARQAYPESYFKVQTDPNLVPQQRIDCLRQIRHYRMEALVSSLAERHGMKQSPTMLAENGQHYIYVTGGDVGMTQSYVRMIGELPKPSRYFERLASMNRIPRLDLGDEPKEVLIGKSFYGLIAHNPIGRQFNEDEQKLGMIQLCVPHRDAKSYALELAIEDLTAAYTDEKPDRAAKPSPVWKDRGRDGKKQDGKG
jgi:hypothetical protein